MKSPSSGMCNLVEICRRFGETYCLFEKSLLVPEVSILGVLNPENVGRKLKRNVGEFY
jgi:hypothetical protein